MVCSLGSSLPSRPLGCTSPQVPLLLLRSLSTAPAPTPPQSCPRPLRNMALPGSCPPEWTSSFARPPPIFCSPPREPCWPQVSELQPGQSAASPANCAPLSQTQGPSPAPYTAAAYPRPRPMARRPPPARERRLPIGHAPHPALCSASIC